MLASYEMYVGGKWAPASSGKTLVSVDPWQQEDWATFPAGDAVDVEGAVKSARVAFDQGEWSTNLRLRVEVLERFAGLLDEHAERLARIESRDNGKTIREELGLYGAMSAYFRFAVGVARSHRDQAPAAVVPDVHAVVRRVPYGVIGIQTPWNTPGLILAQSAAPALAAGNCIIVKPSEIAPISTLEIAAIADTAGFPAGVFNVVTGLGPIVGAALSSSAGVDKLVFTGGPTAGSQVASLGAGHLVPTLLELGGKSANVVFADADLDAAVEAVVDGFTAAAGQSCMCGSRALVERSIYEDVLAKIVHGVGRLQLGDPGDLTTDVGPISSAQHKKSIQAAVDQSVVQGARILCGGGSDQEADHPLLFAPTVVDHVNPEMSVWQDEVFGPVLALMPFEDEREALTLANGTRYGLATGIWTRDLGRAHRMADGVRSGTVWVNQYRRGHPSLPIGGVGASGYGRLSGTESFVEMTQAKSIEILIPRFDAGGAGGAAR